MRKPSLDKERRSKHRFPMQREVRFKVFEGDHVIMTGTGQTINISSSGVAFETANKVGVPAAPGTLVELSISWPILLEETCLMRLVTFGQVVRTRQQVMACTVERYEFRTQARACPMPVKAPLEILYRRWGGTPVKEAKVVAGAGA
jgi:hypothetical protein